MIQFRTLGVFFLIIIVGEVLAFFVFAVIRLIFRKGKFLRWPDAETLRGVIERFVIYVGLANGYLQVLVLFGALKIGTKLKPEDKPLPVGVANDYYLVGNLLSVLIAMLDSALFAVLCQQLRG